MLAAARFIEQNPVRAGLAATPWDYPWSGAAVHVAGTADRFVRVAPFLALMSDWRGFLAAEVTEAETKERRRHERSGRPVGGEHFILAVERRLGRTLRRGKPGPKGVPTEQVSMVSPELGGVALRFGGRPFRCPTRMLCPSPTRRRLSDISGIGWQRLPVSPSPLPIQPLVSTRQTLRRATGQASWTC